MILTKEQEKICQEVMCSRLDWILYYDKNGKEIEEPECVERSNECLCPEIFKRLGLKNPYEIKYK